MNLEAFLLLLATLLTIYVLMAINMKSGGRLKDVTFIWLHILILVVVCQVMFAFFDAIHLFS